MSYSKLTPPNYTPRKQDQALINSLHHQHDLCCGCDNAPSHLTYLLIKNCNPHDYTKKEKQEIKQWCTTLEEEDHSGDGDIDFAPGELERLFSEDDGDTDG